ncbi:probable 10 kDa chaperonin [Coccomyxa sp. Obi]|nr:probable 10 kDa chaperonin [Coccomyxa sp. Obi]
MDATASLRQCKLCSSSTLTRPVLPRYRRRSSCIRASAVELPSQYRKVLPKGDLVLAKVAEAEEKTSAGVLLPSSAQKKPTSGDIVAVGDGRVGETTQSFDLKVGETILYSKFGIGVTDITLQGDLHILIREDDVIGVMPRSGATAADVPELRPAADRVLIKVQDSADVTAGGVLLPDSAKEKPIAGTVVRVGPGKREKDGSRKTPILKEGDSVLYFKWAGDNMETPSGEKYVVVHESDVLCKV